MSVESLIQAGQKGYANIHDNDFYFSDSNFKEIGENEELTKFFMKQVDPDGSKYGGDVEKAKTGFLNDYTFKSNSIWGEVKEAVQSANYSEEERQQKNFLQRMYDTAPNRLTGSDGVSGAAQALGYGLAGGLVGEDGVDLGINIASTAASSLIAAKMGAAAGTAVAPGVGTVVGGTLGAITGGALALFGKGALLKGTQQLTKEGAKQLLKQVGTKEGKDALVKQVAKEYGWNTALAEFAVNGVLGGVGGAAEEYKNENIGLSKGEFTDYLASAGGGVLMAGGIGGALGYVTSRFGEGRRLGKELVQDTRDGQKIMATIGDDGPRTYREAIEQRLKDIEEKEKPTQDEIVQKQQLEAEKKLYDKYRIPLTEEQRQGVNDLCSDLSIQLRQEANELDTFSSTSGHSPEKLRAVADMLDNLLDFNSAEKAVVDAEKALVGGGDYARANLARVKAKWSALRSIGKYLNDNKLGERDSVYSLLDDATFMDFAKNLDDNVKNAIIAENKRIYPEAGLRPGEELQPQTPVTQPKATQAQGKTKPQPDTKANRKKADKAIKDNQSGKSATKIIEELKQEAQANPEESALATMTPDEIQGLQPTLEDVIGGMPKEQASTITQMSQSSVKPDGTPSQVSKSFLDALKSIPEDEGQFNQLVANLSQQSGLPAEQIAPALKAAKQSYATNPEEAKKIAESIERALNDGVSVDNIVNTLVQLYAANRGAGLVHFQREMNCLVNGIKDFGLSVGPDAKIPQKHAKYLVQASDLLTGMRGAPKDDMAAIGWMTSLNNMTMLSMATIASLSDVGLIGVRSGEVMPFLRGIKATMKQMAGGDQAERDAIRSLGVQFETDRMNNFLNNNNGRIQGMNNAFFKATGLTQWTAFSRQMSANVGFEAIKCFQRQAREAIASGNQNSLTYRKAMYWLRTLGLNDPEFINGRALTNYADLIEACKADPSLESMNEKVARAVVKFVNQSAFAPNRADIPAWAQSGFGRLVFQFMSYPLMLGRLTKWALDSARLKNGANIKPLVLLATLGVGMGAGGQALRDVISGRNIDYEDDDQSFADMHSVKQRLASEICRQLGWESWADSLEGTQVDSIIGWYAAGLMGLGALGVIGDFAFNLTESTQDGAYGELNAAKQLFGPSFGTGMDAYHVVKTGYNMMTEGLGIKSERPSNKDERRAFSVLESRIPVVGGFRSLGRELKDYLVPLEEN